MEPWWIINLSGETVGRELEKITRGWTHWKRGSADDVNRWWKLDQFNADDGELIEQILTFLEQSARYLLKLKRDDHHQVGIPAFENLSTQINILLVGDVRDRNVQRCFHLVAQIVRLKAEELFPGRNAKIFGFLFIPQNFSFLDQNRRQQALLFLIELHTLMSQEVVARRPFNVVHVFQDRNAVDANPGYQDLSDDQVYELMGHVLLHFAAFPSSWLEQNLLRHGDAGHYASVGVAALYYDIDHHIAKLSRELGETLLSDFKESNQPPWFDSNTIEVILNQFELKKRLSPPYLFQHLTRTVRPFPFPPKIWQYPKGAGPWHFWKSELFPLYFGAYLKDLPVRLVEYGRIFLARNFQDLHRWFAEGKDLIMKGSHAEDGLQTVISRAARSVWSAAYPACGLKQYEGVLHRIKSEAVSQRSRLAQAIDEAMNSEKLQIFLVPDYLRDFYEKAPDEFDLQEEKDIIQDLRNLLKAHPVPLALFARAFILGIVVIFVGLPVLEMLSPWILNLESFLRIPILPPVVLFMVPVIFAWWRYYVRTLRPVRKLMKRYIAMLLKHAEHRAVNTIVEYIAEVYDAVEKHCDSLLENANLIRVSWQYLEVPPSPMAETLFQQPLEGQFRGQSILTALPAYKIGGVNKYANELDPTEKAELMRAALARGSDRKSLWEIVLDCKFDTASKLFHDCCVEMYSTQRKSLHDWLHEAKNDQALAAMLAISYPPVVLRDGLPPREVVTETKSSQPLPILSEQRPDHPAIDDDNFLSIARGKVVARLDEIALGTLDSGMMEEIVRGAVSSDSPPDSLIYTIHLARHRTTGTVVLLNGKPLELESLGADKVERALGVLRKFKLNAD